MKVYYYNGKAYRKSKSDNVYRYAVYYPALNNLAFYSGDGKNTLKEFTAINETLEWHKANGKWDDWCEKHLNGEIVEVTMIEK